MGGEVVLEGQHCSSAEAESTCRGGPRALHAQGSERSSALEKRGRVKEEASSVRASLPPGGGRGLGFNGNMVRQQP